jgi:Ca-activated chloride channel family protein
MLAFDRPWALLFLLTLPALALARRFLAARNPAFPHADGQATAGAHPAQSPAAPPAWRAARALRALCVAAGMAASAIAAAGPAIVDRRVVYLSRGNEVIFVLDLSPSMAASDFAPTRLEAAKAIIDDFLSTRRNETVGLVAFGDDAALVCPPTLDYASFASRMRGLDPGLYGEGTAIGAGIATAVAHAARSGAPEKHLVLLTDGENNAGSMDPGTAALLASRNGILLSVIGVGGPGEAPVSYVDPATGEKRSGYYRSDFDAEFLKGLARNGGGQYYAAENRAALAAAFSALSERSASLSRTRSAAVEEPLAPSFLLIALGALLLARLFGLAGAGAAP